MLELFSFAIVVLLGAISPGPDFAIITRHALTGSRKAALYATLGITTAILIHVTYCLFGLGLFLVEMPKLFYFIQILGGLYLGYLGVHLLISKKTAKGDQPVRFREAFFSGFLTNLLNPKAVLFILSILARFINPTTPIYVLVEYGITIALVTFVWFGILSFVITHKKFRPHFAKFQKALMKVMGVILLILAVSVFFSIGSKF